MAIVTTLTGAALTAEGLGIDVSGAVSKVLNGVGSIFGTPRSTKRRRRDRYVGELHAAGLKQSIGQVSDYYDSAEIFARLQRELGNVVVGVLNENPADYGHGSEIPRRGTSEFQAAIAEIERQAKNMYQPDAPASTGAGESGAATAAGFNTSGANVLLLAAGAVLLFVVTQN